MILLLFLGLFLTGPVLDAGAGPNACYVLTREMMQTHPCRPEETRGWKNR